MKIIPVFVLAAIVAASFSSGAHAAVPNKDLSFGSRGEDVVSLQHELIAYGGPAAQALSKVGATGYFGPLTRAALVEFQKNNGITPAAGYFGAKTRAALSLRAEPEVLYTGTISAVDTGCFVDAVCSVTVGGKKVVLLTGERLIGPRETGALKGVDSIGDLEGKIGAEARVYAAKLNKEWGDYTLEGKSN
ncbi:MAG TPA: peptidoglycan-binding domain-containing protein, partial [Candidatus Paceibacterota bacterium]